MSESVPFQAVFNGRVPAPQLEPNGTPRRGCPLSDLRDRLRRAGLRPTRQRLSLGWLLFGRGDRHLTAEMLYDEAMRAKVPVSLATVYNTLHQFTEAGLLRQLALDGSKAYFDTNPSEHHHFYLEDESQVIDMPDCGITVDSLPEAPEGMEIAGVEVIVRLRRSRPAGRRQSRTPVAIV
jgi:Fur family iron response transcriptional regulator